MHCQVQIPPKRIEILPNTKTCVKCSNVQPKRGESVQMGTGDHTWTETIIFDSISELDEQFKGDIEEAFKIEGFEDEEDEEEKMDEEESESDLDDSI